MNGKPSISVVAATCNRAESLTVLLEALATQTDAPLFEVVIVDNGSRDTTAEAIESFHGRLSLLHLREEMPGKGRALNKALEAAHGELILLTDDDVKPNPDWLQQMHRASAMHPEIRVFGGRILIDESLAPLWVSRSYNLMGLLAARHDRGEDDAPYGYGEYPFGPNLAVRFDCLTGMHRPYPEDIGPGMTRPVGDESAFLRRISPPEAIDRMYIGSAGVKHDVQPGTFRFGKAFRRCLSAGYAHGQSGVPHSSPGDGSVGSDAGRIVQRLRTCRSLRELTCISVRYLGYLLGRLNAESPDREQRKHDVRL
jgi:hypothetical protein